MQKISALALGLGTILIASFLSSSCGNGNGGSSSGKDSGQSEGGASGTGGTVGADAKPSAGGSSGADAGISTVPACTGFNACGGSIVGTWKLPGKVLCGSAGSGTQPPSTCTAQNNLADLFQGGTLTFSESGNWDSSITFNGTETLTYPASCLSGGVTCASRTASDPDAGMVGSCVENTSGACVCTYTVDNISMSGQGTYTTAGGRLSVVGSDPSSMDYCVQGNTLSMYAVNSTTDDQATQVYQRQ